MEDRLDRFLEVIRPEDPASAVSQPEVLTEPVPGSDEDHGARSGETGESSLSSAPPDGLLRKVPTNEQYVQIRQTARKLKMTHSQFAMLLIRYCQQDGRDPVQIMKSAVDLYERLAAISSKDKPGGDRLN